MPELEQKNWTHLNKVVGYRRFDNTSELRLLNESYGVLPLYKNFFLPSIKLASKTRGPRDLRGLVLLSDQV